MRKYHILLFIIFLMLFSTCEEGTINIRPNSSKITIETDTSHISFRSASLNGILSSTNGALIKDYGHCWDTVHSPDLSKHKTSHGNYSGPEQSFTDSLENLIPGKKYFFRAFFVIGNITIYSVEKTFECSDLKPPCVSTSNITDIDATKAICGGSISNDGGSMVTSKGVCFGLYHDPTISDQRTDDGSGSISYSSLLTGLYPDTTYYARAYASNSAGVGYGEEKSFRTRDGIIQVYTEPIINVTTNSMTCEGYVSSDGGSPVTARGICWKTSQNPTINDNNIVSGNGNGSFKIDLTNLTSNTRYFVRAFATNSIGTVYGEEYYTITWYGEVIDIDGNKYNTIKIGNQIWMAENLRVTHFEDGSEIPLVIENSQWLSLEDSDKAYTINYGGIQSLKEFGGYYTWAAAMNGSSSSSANPSGIKGVCPTGWHMPSKVEWDDLNTQLGDSAGGKLKETGFSHWSSPNIGATNESGFSAQGNGCRRNDGSYGGFLIIGKIALFWSTSNYLDDRAIVYSLSYENSTFVRDYHWNYKKFGLSIRCVKD